jgi:hypothetical protein
MPVFQMIRDGIHTVLLKLLAQILISGLATLVVTAIAPIASRPAPHFAPESTPAPSLDGEYARTERGEPLADFLERVALTHVAALREQPPVVKQPGSAAARSNKSTAAVPLPPARPPAAPRHEEPGSDEMRISHAAQKDLPLQPPLIATPPAPEPAEAKPFVPSQYGTVAKNVGDFVSASNMVIVSMAASIGDALTSLVKKL